MREMVARLVSAALLFGLMVTSASATEIRVSAAASLKEAMIELGEIYAKKIPGAKVVTNFGASGTLAQQILAGAPADIFISANVEWIEQLRGKGVVLEQSVRPFTFNTLVFVTRTESKAAIGRIQDLPRLERIAVGSPKSVPAGAYAMEALKKSHLDKPLEKKLIFAKDVREALMYAERGDVDGAFVYRSDALQAKAVTARFTVGRALVPRIIYPMVLTKDGGAKGQVNAFYRFLQGGTAKAVLAKYGFSRN